ncbi:hypothetical protein SAMN05192568_102113 [Methylobacterium pseudosasicola]|uniref:Uncharacterized protein n=1 Tax=Methylobacterium pseudosasicola TaxID=582667 RepID=A0A1I4NJS5_9HYPH|nr:hypothetical protein SAMN05192568_102113 [Methylobacterium pseudosasicola]
MRHRPQSLLGNRCQHLALGRRSLIARRIRPLLEAGPHFKMSTPTLARIPELKSLVFELT